MKDRNCIDFLEKRARDKASPRVNYVRPITESGRITLAYNIRCTWFEEK